MSTSSKQLAARLAAFNDDLIQFVRDVDADAWSKVCAAEAWPVNVVAHHIGFSHYRAVGLAKLIIGGAPVPAFSHDTIDAVNKDHAEKYAGCTQAEVLAILQKYGTAMVDYVAGLTDEDINRTGEVPAMGGKFSAGQILERMVLQSGADHMDSMRRATGNR